MENRAPKRPVFKPEIGFDLIVQFWLVTCGTAPVSSAVEVNLTPILKDQLDERSSVPLYRQLADAIRSLVQDGRLKPGDRLAPERKLTEELGVSRRTVRAALAELIETHYVEATHGRGNFVLEPPLLRQLRILIPERFRPSLLGALPDHYDIFHRAELATQCKIHYEYIAEIEAIEQLLTSPPREFDGILIFRPPQEMTDRLRRLAAAQAVFPLPTIIVNRDLSGTGLHFVTADHFNHTRRATEQLLSLGHRQIGYISFNPAMEVVRQSLQGYQTALDRALPPEEPRLPVLEALDYEKDPITRQIIDYLGTHKPTAVVLGGTVFSIPFDNAARQLGLRIPQELSVVATSEEISLQKCSLDYTAYIEQAELVALQALRAVRRLAQGEAGVITEIIPPLYHPGNTVAPR